MFFFLKNVIEDQSLFHHQQLGMDLGLEETN